MRKKNLITGIYVIWGLSLIYFAVGLYVIDKGDIMWKNNLLSFAWEVAAQVNFSDIDSNKWHWWDDVDDIQISADKVPSPTAPSPNIRRTH